MNKRIKIGIDFGATRIKMSIVDTMGKITCRRVINTPFNVEQDKVIKLIADNIEELTAFAKAVNSKAIKIWDDVGKKLGVALTGVVNLLNPDKIIVGGGVSNAGVFILGPLKKEIMTRAMKDHAGHVKVSFAKLGEDAGIIGAALLV